MTSLAQAVVRIAFITGITGQDGRYLAELLLSKGYEVHGLQRRSSVINTGRIAHLLDNPAFLLHYGDMTDPLCLSRLIREIEPDEVYNLAAQSHVHVSFEVPVYTSQADALGVLYLLEVIRAAGLAKKTRFYQASTSELFGKVQEVPQTETTPFYPRSPYAVAKQYAFWITVNYRESYGMFACNGILFNHESPVRGEIFVTRKITQAVARIACGLQELLQLGNLDAQRDWGYAKEYVEAMWLMLQQDEPHDLVIATGKTHTVREFAQKAFARAGIRIEWRGTGIDEVGVDAQTGKVRVAIDPEYLRPAEVDLLVGDASKARALLGWQSQTTFEELVNIMVDADLQQVRRHEERATPRVVPQKSAQEQQAE